MSFIEYKFTISPPQPWTEILLAKLSQIEFDSFEETATGLNAYILADFDDYEFILEQIEDLAEAQISFEKQEINQQNWNEEWEKNFNPILVDERCYIRAEFHPEKPEIPWQIVIQPKMSFGTGHHETTHLMVQYVLDTEFRNKSMLDVGTGTGILAILAKMKGAELAEGIDIDEWSYENAVENALRNGVDVNFYKGGAECIPERKYDLIFANINKNILIADMQFYIHALQKGGYLYLSGIYNFDEEDMLAVANKFGLKFVEKKTRNDWIALKFKYE